MKNLLQRYRKRYRTITALLIALALAATLVACASPSTGNGGNGGNGGNNSGTPQATQPSATATPKPKPTGVPTLTVAICTQLMSVDEANSIIQPKTLVKTVVPTNGDTGGACNYEASKTNIPLIIYFVDWNGPNPIPQSDIAAELSQVAGNDITINTATPVTGIGDQAEYLDATGSFQGLTAVAHVFYVLDGQMIFNCFTYSPISGGTMASQSQLQQCATQVFSRL
jgi:hypothetical protein